MLNEYSDVLTVKQLSKALGIGINSAYKLIKEQKIGSVRIGKSIRIPKACVANYLNSARYIVTNDNSRPTVERSKQ